MQKLLIRDWHASETGSYSVEGALSITIFTVCLLAAFSILSIIRVELEVQDAINQTAIELSQYTYAVGKVVPLSDTENDATDLGGTLQSIFMDQARETVAEGLGAPLAKSLAKKHFSRTEWEPWLQEQGIAGGYAALDFSGTSILGDGKTISITVTYPLQVQTYGLFSKQLTICQTAETLALLPENASLLEALRNQQGEETEESIWKSSNFIRGRYFISKLKAENTGQAVASGVGIDFYDAGNGIYREAYSMNLFSSTYSTCNGDVTELSAYTLNQEATEKQIQQYANRLEKDIQSLNGTILMESGKEEVVVPAKRKILILILPEECQKNETMQSGLQQIKANLQKQGTEVEYRYEQEAL